MNQLKYLIIFGLIFGNQALASVGTTTIADTKASSSPVVKQVTIKASSTVATSTVVSKATSSVLVNPVATATPEVSTSTFEVASSSITSTIPITKTDENLSKLYGSVDPISLDVASTSTSTDDSLAATEDSSSTAESDSSSTALDGGSVQQPEIASSEPRSLAADISYLSSNIIIKLFAGLALIFLLAAIIFYWLAKRHDRRNDYLNG